MSPSSLGGPSATPPTSSASASRSPPRSSTSTSSADGCRSLKALQDDPLVELRQRIGRTVTGPVTKAVPFGVFVRVEDDEHGFEGLLHNSEPGERTAEIGDVLTVKIAQVDVTRRRIGLTLAR
ncbi:S1 RNA-binding domain-containing protein [Actinomadura sp. NEAU-AAG7]|nr:S1 RNA-binding domain-containing protein [Actinomadura sp. NEAU-AAG7]